MQRFEYKVVPAPKKGEKARGARTTPERFAVALTTVMNTLGAAGWDYVRADTLPCDERVGLTGSKTVFQHMLVFRRALAEEKPAGQTAALRTAPTISAIPKELFADPEPSEVPPLTRTPNGAGEKTVLLPGVRHPHQSGDKHAAE